MKKIYLLFTILLSCATQAQQTDQPIHVQVSGYGAPILLIPGFTVPGDSWEATVNQLEENYECHVLTLAGFGGKSPIEFPWLPKVNASIENYIQEKTSSTI